MVCRICGCKVTTTSELDDVGSTLSCWKKAHPQLFENALPWDKEMVVTTMPHELHEQLREGLEKKTLKQKIVDLFTFWRRK